MNNPEVQLLYPGSKPLCLPCPTRAQNRHSEFAVCHFVSLIFFDQFTCILFDFLTSSFLLDFIFDWGAVSIPLYLGNLYVHRAYFPGPKMNASSGHNDDFFSFSSSNCCLYGTKELLEIICSKNLLSSSDGKNFVFLLTSENYRENKMKPEKKIQNAQHLIQITSRTKTKTSSEKGSFFGL